MLLDLSLDQIKSYLYDFSKLYQMVGEACAVLNQFQTQAPTTALSQQVTSAKINEGPKIESSSSSNSNQLNNQILINSGLKEEEKKDSSNIQKSFPPTIPATNILAIDENPFEGTDCANPIEISYFTKTVPYLKNKKFKAKKIF
jgi:hypothetical protein